MTQKTVTRADIAEALYQELGFSHADSFALNATHLNFNASLFMKFFLRVFEMTDCRQISHSGKLFTWLGFILHLECYTEITH